MNLQHKKCAPFKQCLLFSDDENLEKPRTNGKANKLSIDDKQFHDWYRFVLSFPPHLVREYINIFGLKTGNTILLAETIIPDATPGIIALHAINDEQALLAKLRYNRLIDIFVGITCYSLQNHLRTTVPGMGQVETDEIYVGLDQRGAQYVLPVQAKCGTGQLGIVQIEQDFALCANKFPKLICRPIAAQFVEDNIIALFSFEEGENGIAISDEKHYRLVPPDQMTDADLENYRKRINKSG